MAGHEDPFSSIQSWAAFCDRMKALGEEISSERYPADPQDRAEGVRHLARMLVLGLQWRLEVADTEFPLFQRHEDDLTQWGGPNLDNTYLRAAIDGAATYRIDGNVAGLHNVIISTGEADMHEGRFTVGGDLDLGRLKVDENGYFELILSPDKHAGNWLQTSPAMTFVLIRAYYYDWAKNRPAEFHIVKVGNEGLAPPRIAPAQLGRGLARAADWIESGVRYWNEYQHQARSRLGADNTLSAPARTAGGSANIVYGDGWFNLAADEALIIESRVPRSAYWNLQYYTPAWFEAPDYANRISSLNGAQVHIDSDGKVRWVIAHRDPGVQNWIDTGGRREGYLMYRWMWSEDLAEPQAKLVRFAELQRHLPADTPAFSVEQRRQQLIERRRHVERRFHQ